MLRPQFYKHLKTNKFVAAGPVSRILSAIADGTAIPLGPASLLGSSGLPGGLARRAGTRRWRTSGFLPIWPCSVWGLPCPTHYCGGGALLPHLFTLTLALPPGRYILCGTFRRTGLNPASRTLSGTLLCGVRTFLPHSLTERERPSGPAANLNIICDGG
jgi:hypothetical protein